MSTTRTAVRNAGRPVAAAFVSLMLVLATAAAVLGAVPPTAFGGSKPAAPTARYTYDTPTHVAQSARAAADSATTLGGSSRAGAARSDRWTAPGVVYDPASRRRATKAEPRLLGPAGDAAAAGLSRVDRVRVLAREGVRIGDEQFGINPHLINSVRKSGRRHITPEDLIDALRQTPTPGTPGSRVYRNRSTGTRFFVNDDNVVVGAHPERFK